MYIPIIKSVFCNDDGNNDIKKIIIITVHFIFKVEKTKAKKYLNVYICLILINLRNQS